MAELFIATSPGEHGFQKRVVIKRLLPQLLQDEMYNAMFIDEAKLTARLVHPKIAQTFELGKVDDALYIAMEYIDGIDVLALLREFAANRRRVEPQLAAWIVHEVLDALDYAHNLVGEDGNALGIVHRDISPSNVLLSVRGDVKLVDFGIARAVDPDRAHKSKSGTLKGKYGYMSPEQVIEQPLDARSDVFSVGVVLAELLTGRRLFAAANELDVLLMVRDAKLGRFDKYGADLEPNLSEIVRKALKKSLDERWSSAAAFRDALAEWQFDQRHRVTNKHVADVVAGLREAVLERRERDNSVPAGDVAVGRVPSEDSAAPQVIVDGDTSMPVISVSYESGPAGKRPISVSDLSQSAASHRAETVAARPATGPGVTPNPAILGPVNEPALPRARTLDRQAHPGTAEPPDRPLSVSTEERGKIRLTTSQEPLGSRPRLATRDIPRDVPITRAKIPTGQTTPISRPRVATSEELPLSKPRIATPDAAISRGRVNTNTVTRTAHDARDTRTALHGSETPDSISAAVEAITAPASSPPVRSRDPRVDYDDDSAVRAFDDLTHEPRPPSNVHMPTAEEALRKRPPTPPALSNIAEAPDDAGEFNTTSPLRVLFRLMTARATGLLVVQVGGIKKEIYVRDGQPEYVSSNVASELFGNYLVTKGVLADGELAMALAMMPHYGGKLGDTLVGLGLLKPLEVFRHLTRQVRTKIIDVCTWNKGSFSWYAGRENPRDAFPLDFNAFEILGAGALALADEFIEGWIAKHSGLRLRASRTRRVGPERFEVKGLVPLCELLDGKQSVTDLVELQTDRGERLRAGRMLYLVECCDLARPA